jgi:hypothetical protein
MDMINKLVRLSLATAFVAFTTATVANAQVSLNNRTVMTFSQPIEVPGKILPAGTYTFEMLTNDTGSHGRVVQIFDEGGTKLQALALVIPSYRAKATEETIVRFAEVAPGQPQAIRFWYYPGQTAGHEFVYSKSRARELAAAANLSVQSTADTVYVDAVMEKLNAAEVTVLEPEKKVEAKVEAVVTQPEPVTPVVTPVVTPEPVRTEPVATPAPAPMRDELPRTASTLPMVMFVGAALLALGLALRGAGTAAAKR